LRAAIHRSMARVAAFSSDAEAALLTGAGTSG
jgi:hypothetical protein